MPVDPKYNVQHDTLPDGTFVPAGTTVQYFPILMGRDAKAWAPDPLAVRPERWFAGAAPAPVSSFAYPVFQAGPRICLGMNFAYLEAKVLVCALCQRFRLRLAPDQTREVEPNVTVTLSIRNGLRVVAIPRE